MIRVAAMRTWLEANCRWGAPRRKMRSVWVSTDGLRESALQLLSLG